MEMNLEYFDFDFYCNEVKVDCVDNWWSVIKVVWENENVFWNR